MKSNVKLFLSAVAVDGAKTKRAFGETTTMNVSGHKSRRVPQKENRKVLALTPVEAIRSVSVQLDIESRLSHPS